MAQNIFSSPTSPKTVQPKRIYYHQEFQVPKMEVLNLISGLFLVVGFSLT